MPAASRWRMVGAIAVGGAAGSVGRAWLASVAAWPWLSVSAVNLTGAFALGVVAAWPGLRPHWRALWATGLCGAWTTYSGLVLLAATGWRPLLAAATQLLVGAGLARAGLGAAHRWAPRPQAAPR